MKRIISLCCIVLILVSSMAVPVRADDINNSNVMMELLDYGTVNSSGNFFHFNGTTGIGLSLPFQSSLFYCDILFTMVSGTGAPLSSVRADWNGVATTSLTVVNVSGDLYRAYGSVPSGNYTIFGLHFDGSTSSTYYITLHSVKVMPVRMSHFESECYCHIVSTLYNNLIHYVPTDDINYRYIDASGQAIETEFTLNLYLTDWQKYDYIDFSLLLSCESVTSVTASFGDILLDFDVSEIENSSQVLKDFRVYTRLDLTGIDRNSSDIPTVVITGQWASNLVNLVQVLGCSGFVDIESLNPVYYYFRNLISICSTGFSNLNSWISNQTSALTGSLSVHFGNLNSWIDNQTNSIVSAIRGDTGFGDDIKAGAEEIESGVNDIGQFEKDQQAVLDNNFNTIQASVDISSFANAFDFVALCGTLVFTGMGDYIIVFTLPLFLGIFFFISSKVPGATRWKSRPPKDGDT